MTIIQLDTSIKNDEGVVHQFMKKILWYNITKKKGGHYFSKRSDQYNNDLKLENKKAYIELEIKLDDQIIIPDISVFDDEGNIETVIECIDTSRPSLKKYECYINSNINVIFIDTTAKIERFKGYMYDCDLIILKDNPFRYRFIALLKHLAKLNHEWTTSFRFIGKFEDDDNYFLFSKDGERDGVRFFTSTMYSNGSFSKSNSKKIPVLLERYVEKFCDKNENRPLIYNSPIWVPREDYMMGVRRYDKKVINYWRL
jgi:hypothetical protein